MRVASALLALILAPLGVSLGTRALADALGHTLGREMASALAVVQPRTGERPSVPHALVQEPAPAPLATPSASSSPAPNARGASTRPVRSRSKAAAQSVIPSTLGVRVGSHKVLELAEHRVIPSARPVPAEGTRPAGLELFGVSGLGVGMRDGDVLTSVAGVPVTSLSAVAELVLSARARRAPEISAQFWRSGVPGSLVVEQPYAR